MWQQHQCRLCGDIISDHRQRRVLHSEVANHARIVLLELLAVHIPDKSTTELQQLLLPNLAAALSTARETFSDVNFP